jgi:hypothetical protein
MGSRLPRSVREDVGRRMRIQGRSISSCGTIKKMQTNRMRVGPNADLVHEFRISQVGTITKLGRLRLLRSVCLLCKRVVDLPRTEQTPLPR